jgi:glyoxylase-like metal-dependent hydrolase (beta-lactamase superfamily II)
LYFKQFYLGCLAHASYLIGGDGEAAVVDPQRDIDIYLEEAKAHGLQIKHVIETHCHADFVSGSSIACSLLEQLGFRSISNVVGRITTWNNAKLPIVS